MALRTLIWGCGGIYKKYYNLIEYQKLKGYIDVVGITGRQEEYEYIDEYKFLPKNKLGTEKIDAIIMAVGKDLQDDILKEMMQLNICVDNIIPVDLLEIPGMNVEKYFAIKNRELSIISSSCWGGIAYHYLKLPFLSPFINVSISEDDFLKLMSDFRHYMEMKLEFAGWRSVAATGGVFPYFKLGDITVLFPHDDNPDVVLENWERRKVRINYDNLLFVMGTRQEEKLKKFQMQPCTHKRCFTSFYTDSPIGCYLPVANCAPRLRVEHFAITILTGSMHGYNLFDILG